MGLFDNLVLGFEVALTWQALWFCFMGVSVGMFIGVLPGIGPLAAISMLLPLTYYTTPTNALIMLAGIYYGSQYGGSVSSILLRLPGEASTAITAIDGYEMTRKGRAGAALLITTVASFVGGTIGIILMTAFAPLLADLALSFGSAEMFALMVAGLTAASALTDGSPVKGFAMVAIGLIVGIVGMDVTTGVMRFTYDQIELLDGVNLVAAALGLFGVSEILANIGQPQAKEVVTRKVTLRSMMPTWQETRDAIPATLRGSAAGVLFGILPGASATISSFFSYAVEKRFSRNRDRLGTGAVEGVAGPEAANNAAAQTAFIPALTLGIPGNPLMALMLGAMIVHGVAPGARMLTNTPDVFWGLVASFWIGNLMLLILNIPLIGIWVRMLTVPYRLLYPAIMLLIVIGVYSVNNSVFDIYVLVFFGLLGYAMRLLGFSPAPLVLGLVLGPMLEDNLRRSLMLSDGDYSIFVTRPISCGLLVLTVLLIALALQRAWVGKAMAPAGDD